MSKYPQTFLVMGFIAALVAVGVIDTAADLRRGDRPPVVELFGQRPTRANLRAVERDVEKRSAVTRTLRPWMQAAQFALGQHAGDKALVGRDGWLFYRPAVASLTESMPARAQADQGDIVRAVVSFRDQLAARGIALLLVPAPNKASVYPDKLAARAAGLDRPVNPDSLAVLSQLRQAGVEVVDLFDVFARARRQLPAAGRRDYYLAQDSHWSPEGMALAARAVAERIVQSGWIERGDTAYTVRQQTLDRHGDILRMMQVPQIQDRFAPERLTCTQVVDAGDRLYQDDPNAPVLVLGDSFLRIYSRDEPRAAGFVEHLAYELGCPVASIVNDGGASTLVRQELCRKAHLLAGKKLVVWEFVERDIRFGTEGWQIITLPER